MGTHPIFESDFDCLTDFRMSLEAAMKAWEEIGRGLKEKKDEPQNDVPMDMPQTSPIIYALRTIPFGPGDAHIDPQPKPLEEPGAQKKPVIKPIYLPRIDEDKINNLVRRMK